MVDEAAAEAQWHEWVVEACAAVGIDPQLVDVTMIHDLTRDIAHQFARPMAPVGSFILGVAIGQAGSDLDGTRVLDLTTRLRQTL